MNRKEKRRLDRQACLKELSRIRRNKILKRLANKAKAQDALRGLNKKDTKVKRNNPTQTIADKRRERRVEVKVINSRRDKKKELEARIARQREKSRVRTDNKRTRKEKLREALIEKRKAS